MDTFLQGLIMSFREGLEAFLIIMILLKFLEKSDNKNLKKNVWYGVYAGMSASIIFGLILMGISSYIGGISSTAKLWESLASFIAVLFIITFVIWMIKHGSQIKHHIENKASLNLSKKGIFLIAMLMVAREGVEIALFQFSGKYTILPIISGITISVILVTLIYYSLVKVNLQLIFNITLAYLILQAGFLMGYSIHEGLSAFKALGFIDGSNVIFTKAFDLSKTILYHKEGMLGVPLYVTFGWYSKPEWIQFIVQYGLVSSLFLYWYKIKKKAIK
ncbi:MAG: FTR1 family protein [Candidatus Delongbacteria bacterium]|jgi:high-affinity iron transporter|nr:FTR1 family protein [Candidatus Delongbacteria bacterium]